MKNALILASLMASGLMDDRIRNPNQFVDDNYELKGPKNKFDLTEEELEKMESMTPKEKKKFLKLSREERQKW